VIGLKRLWIVLVAVLLWSIPVWAAADFRNVSWGMSEKDVIQAEERNPENQGDDFLSFKDRVLGLDAMMFYKFDKSGLKSAYLWFYPIGLCKQPTDAEQYVRDYYNIKAALESKYGKFNGNDEVQLKEGTWNLGKGFDVFAGYIGFISEWKVDRTQIRLVLVNNENVGMALTVFYDPVSQDANKL
jgi:hypothetical protein